MAKRKYSIVWDNEAASAFEVDGVTYPTLEAVPDPRDRQKLEKMLASPPGAAFSEEKRQALRKSALQAEDIILWVFSGVAALMLLIAGIATFSNFTTLANEKSAPGIVVDTVIKREYVNVQDRIITEYYYPVVRFTADDGHRRDVQMSVGSDALEYEKGDEVTVRYDRNHPLEARIDSAGNNALMWILPAITGLLGICFLGAVLVARQVMK
jgi:hypothetical protein